MSQELRQRTALPSTEFASQGESSSTHFPWIWFVATLCVVKAAILAIDFHLFAFLGDSMSYMETARSGWIPADRSFTYGFTIRLATAFTHSLYGLLVFQTLAGIATAILTVIMLVRHIRVSRTIAFIIGLALAIEPSQLMFERMIMAECMGTLLFVAMLTCVFEAISRGHRRAMVAAAVLAVATVSYRSSLLGAVTTSMLVLAPLALLADRQFRNTSVRSSWIRRLAVYAACSIGCFALLLSSYAVLYGRLLHYPPGLNYYDGFFSLAAISQSVTPQDSDDPRIAEALARPRMPGKMRGRNAELCLPQGMINQLIDVFSRDYYRANVAAKSIVLRTVMRDPLALYRSARRTYIGLISPTAVRIALQSESGYDRTFSAPQAALMASYGVPADRVDGQLTPVRGLYHASCWWFIFLLHATILVPWMIIVLYRPLRPLLLLPATAATALVTTALLLSPEPVARYMHPLIPVFAIAFAALLQICLNALNRARGKIAARS